MAAPIQRPSSQARLSLVAIRLSSLCGQHVTYAVGLKWLGRQEHLGSHSSCPSSCLPSNSSLLYPLLLGSLDTPTPPRGMAHCPEGPRFHTTKSLVLLSPLPRMFSPCFTIWLQQHANLQPGPPARRPGHGSRARTGGRVSAENHVSPLLQAMME